MKERDEKIQKIMMKMGEVNVGGFKEKEQIKKAEKDYIDQCLQKDEEARQQDVQSKLEKRLKNLEVRNYLESQVNEKRNKRQIDLDQNKVYIQQLKEKEQEQLRKDQESKSKLKQGAVEHAEFIKSQMTKPLPFSNEANLLKKLQLGG